MRLSNTQAVARPQPIDRNPVNRTQYQNPGGIAPHAFTTRYTYTVPAGKKAIAEAVFSLIGRQAAAAPVGLAQIQTAYTPSGGALTLIDWLWLGTNGVNDVAVTKPWNLGGMATGDAISAGDGDASTGGTVQFVMANKIFEYDA